MRATKTLRVLTWKVLSLAWQEHQRDLPGSEVALKAIVVKAFEYAVLTMMASE